MTNAFLQSQAIKTPSAIYCSGQVHLTSDGVLIDGSIAEKTRKCCENIDAILKAADSSLSNVVKTTVFISDVSYFAVSYITNLYSVLFANLCRK